MATAPPGRVPWQHPQVLTGAPMRLPRASDGSPPPQGGPLVMGSLRSSTGGFVSPSAPSRPVALPGLEEVIRDRHHYAHVIDLVFPAVNGQSKKFLDEPSGFRNFLMMRNASPALGANLYIGHGRDATLQSTMVLSPGAIILLDVVVPQDDLYVYADAINGVLAYSYSVIAQLY